MIQKTYLILLWIFRIKNIWLLSKCIFKHWLQFFVFTFLRKSSWMSGKIASICKYLYDLLKPYGKNYLGFEVIFCFNYGCSDAGTWRWYSCSFPSSIVPFFVVFMRSILLIWCRYSPRGYRRDPWKRWTGTIRSSRTWGSRSSPRFAWAFSRLILSAWRCNRGIRLQNCKWRSLILAKKKVWQLTRTNAEK